MKLSHQRIRALFPLWGSGSVRELPPHRDAGLEIVCVSRGRLRWRIEDRVYEPGPGYVFYTFPWELHGSIDEFEPGHRWDFVILTILGRQPSRRRTLPPAFGLAPVEGRHLLDRLMRSPHRSLPAGDRLKWLLPELQKELAAPQGADLAIAATLGKAVLLELDRMVAQAASARPPSLERRPDRCETLLRRLQSDYAETWNLKAMSQIMRLGRTRLGQLIKERTGDSPIVHLNRLRVGKAQELLRHTTQSVTDIAFGCGFQSSQYFARTFKQLTGRTPGGYRAAYHRSNVIARNGSTMARSAILLALTILLGGLCPILRAVAADDTLPNFNAPVDNSPLNVDKVNRAFGIAMFKEPSLWDEDAIFVAKRLGWPEESRTFSQSSYRLYPTEKNPVNILGARAYSCVLYASHDKPTEVSIVFVNEGDYEWTQNFLKEAAKHEKPADDSTVTPLTNSDSNPGTNAAPNAPPTSDSMTNGPGDFKNSRLSEDDVSEINHDVHDAFEKALKQDAQTITDALTRLFGDPAHMGFGGGTETRERVLRWDWQGHAFLLSTPKDTYVTLRIVPVAFADNYGKADTIARDDLKAMLLKRVKQADSGDVVVSEIPMVDQGPKGYCVPATWERYLRYLGIPADMYVLAMAAGSSTQGTNLDAMVGNVDSLVTLYHRRIETFPGDLDMKMISRNIDKGLPIMWSCSIHIPFERAISRRLGERNKVTDWAAWAAQLETRDKDEIPEEITGTPSAGGHQRMIIGYNDKTGEIAISDSWSKAFAIRWMTLQEANAINAGQSYVIEP